MRSSIIPHFVSGDQWLEVRKEFGSIEWWVGDWCLCCGLVIVGGRGQDLDSGSLRIKVRLYMLIVHENYFTRHLFYIWDYLFRNRYL